MDPACFVRNGSVFFLTLVHEFSFSFCSRWRQSALKGPYVLHPVSQQSLRGCPQNSASVCLVDHRLFIGWNVGRFLCPLLFPSGDQYCDALACPCSESSMCVKTLSTSALPSCRPDSISAMLASLSACSFPLTPAWPGQ